MKQETNTINVQPKTQFNNDLDGTPTAGFVTIVFKLTNIIFFCFFLYSCSDKEDRKLVDRDITERSRLFSNLKVSYIGGEENRDSLKEVIRYLPDDPGKTKLLFDLSYHYYLENDSTEFRSWNRSCFSTATAQRDSSKIAESSWDLANLYADYEIIDSAFYHFNKAALIYEKIGDDPKHAKMLLNMAILQKNIKDYTGSEITTSKAISLLKPKTHLRDIYIAYNNLGIIFNQLAEYDEALAYHDRALDAAEKLGDHVVRATSLNNKGVVYENMQKFDTAVLHFEKSLSVEGLESKDPYLYAMLLDNIAYSKFKINPNEEVLDLFERALTIRDSIGHQSGIVINKIHLGEYYLKQGDTVQSISYLDAARKLASEVNNHRDWLASLLLLSELKKEESRSLLNQYIELNDSLQKQERAIRNKFARIRFETDAYIAENEVLNTQRKWMFAGSTAIICMFSLLLVIRSQRAKNKKLQFEQKQQRANEEIYNLLLEQERKAEEGSLKEKKRISRELHDGVLGKLFGVRFVLDSLNENSDSSSISDREKHLNELRKIEEEIRNISHDLQKVSFSEEIGFLKVVQNLIEENAEMYSFQSQLKSDTAINWKKVSNKTKMNLYRILQESLLNTAKHTQADSFVIQFRFFKNQFLMTISDDGEGFDLTKQKAGIGLKNIEERVRDIRGKFSIESDRSGTRIRIEIPYSDDKES